MSSQRVWIIQRKLPRQHNWRPMYHQEYYTRLKDAREDFPGHEPCKSDNAYRFRIVAIWIPTKQWGCQQHYS